MLGLDLLPAPRDGLLAIAIGLAAGTLLLLANERFLGSIPLSPFIVTLGMWGALRGAAKGIGDNQPIYPTDTGWLGDLMSHGQSGLTSVLGPGVWILLYILAIACTGLAALLQFSYLSIGDPTTADGYELKVIVTAVTLDRLRHR